MPKISVIMPAYNTEKYIGEAIESILNQTFSDFEFIIIDDRSSDGTVDVVKSYNDNRIRFHQNEKNMGVAATLNRGLDLATGDYIARMDSDDISMPERFEKQIQYMENHPDCAACGTDIKLFGAQWGNFFHSSTPEQLRVDLFFASSLAHPTVMIRSAVIHNDFFRYDETLNGVEDYDLWYRISNRYQLGNVCQILLMYRIHPNQVTQHMNEKVFPKLRILKERQLNELMIDSSTEGYEEFIQFCIDKSKLGPNDIARLLAFFRSANRANQIVGLYDKALFSKYIDGVWRSALAGIPRWEAVKIVNSQGYNGTLYLFGRIYSGLRQKMASMVRQRICAKKLKNKDFTIISNNCWGGIISEKYGLKKNSPTCGLLIEGEDYIKFCRKLKYYTAQQLVFIPFQEGKYSYLYSGLSFPVAKLDDIEIYFMHYSSESEAAEKWYRRCKRINWNNIVYKLSERESFDKELMIEFMSLPLENKICFSYDKIDGAIHVPELQWLVSDETLFLAERFDEAKYLNSIK